MKKELQMSFCKKETQEEDPITDNNKRTNTTILDEYILKKVKKTSKDLSKTSQKISNQEHNHIKQDETILALEKFSFSNKTKRVISPESVSQIKKNQQEIPSQDKLESNNHKKYSKKQNKPNCRNSRTQFQRSMFQTQNLVMQTPTLKKTSMEIEPDDTVFINIQKEENDIFDNDDFSDKTPIWALKENLIDGQGRTQEHPDFNSSTIYIPPEEFNSLTPLMKQYWQIKSQNFDQVLMFRIGDFYRMFYEDAIICHKELDLNFLGSKLICGIPVRGFKKYAHELVQRGYKICVADQIEKRKDVERKLGKYENYLKEKVVQRKVSKYMSKGTFITQEVGYEPKYLLSIRAKKNLIAVTFLEVGSNMIKFGHFEDDENYSIFKTLLSQIRPDEILFEKDNLDIKLFQIIKNLPNCPLLSPIKGHQTWGNASLKENLNEFYSEFNNWPDIIKIIYNEKNEGNDLMLSSFADMVSYLKKMLIVDQIILTAQYEIFDPSTFKKTRMILDSQALQHLEILEVQYIQNNRFEGSLLSYVDKTVSKYGKRLMRQWIMAPLLDIEIINQRLQAVEELGNNIEARYKIREQLEKLPDFERMCTKIYKVGAQKNANILFFEDVPQNNLREFKSLLEGLHKVNDFLLKFKQEFDFTSPLIIDLTTLVDYKFILQNVKSGVMPNISSLLNEISDFIVWEGVNKTVPTPKQGVDKDYDAIKAKIEEIAVKLNDYLEEIRKQFNGDKNIRYVHIKCRYELEIPVEYVEGSLKPCGFEFTSKKKGYERFITQRIRDLVKELEETEEKLKSLLGVYICFVFQYFHSFHEIWDQFIRGLAQLDCLCSLSLVSCSNEKMCRPILFPLEESSAFMNIQGLRHPYLSQKIPDFVPNDIILGSKEENGKDNVMLLTGPNMGGKSTILRQVATVAILAQIGCYVPADSCEMTIVDRIFTRIGASDILVQGKSTFYLELEETLNIIKYSSKYSLAIIDELGRGTTTFDGIAIAYAVLNYIIEKIKCRTLFATHYHLLVEEFMNRFEIKVYHMDYKLNEINEKITFLYKLKEGSCSKSFGLNIAKIAGIPLNVTSVAREKAQYFEENCQKSKYSKSTKLLSKVLATILQMYEKENFNFSYLGKLLQG